MSPIKVLSGGRIGVSPEPDSHAGSVAPRVLGVEVCDFLPDTLAVQSSFIDTLVSTLDSGCDGRDDAEASALCNLLGREDTCCLRFVFTSCPDDRFTAFKGSKLKVTYFAGY